MQSNASMCQLGEIPGLVSESSRCCFRYSFVVTGRSIVHKQQLLGSSFRLLHLRLCNLVTLGHPREARELFWAGGGWARLGLWQSELGRGCEGASA